MTTHPHSRCRVLAAGLALSLLAGNAASCQSSTQGNQPPDPPPSAGHALVYHDSLGMVLLLNAGLGGMNDGARAGERSWIWGWENRRWVVLDSSGPPVRNLAAVAYDSHRNRVVMHGGSSVRGVTLGETWEWGPAGWVQRTEAGPGLRDHTAMAYDPLRRRTVLFGGQVRVDSFPADTWEWDGTSWTVSAAAGPPPRVHYGIQFDSVSGRVAVHGGFQPGGGDLGDLWYWDGQSWSLVNQSPARTHFTLAFHGGLASLVALGGVGPGASSVMSAWNGSIWTGVGGAAPPHRLLAAAAYDRSRRVLVLFGGSPLSGMANLADTWEHDGTGWARRN